MLTSCPGCCLLVFGLFPQASMALFGALLVCFSEKQSLMANFSRSRPGSHLQGPELRTFPRNSSGQIIFSSVFILGMSMLYLFSPLPCQMK